MYKLNFFTFNPTQTLLKKKSDLTMGPWVTDKLIYQLLSTQIPRNFFAEYTENRKRMNTNKFVSR